MFSVLAQDSLHFIVNIGNKFHLVVATAETAERVYVRPYVEVPTDVTHTTMAYENVSGFSSRP